MGKPRVAVINYGTGNLLSITNSLKRVGAIPFLLDRMENTSSFNAIIFPGVGAFDSAMGFLSKEKNAILEVIESKIPVLGICLGMQILLSKSEESKKSGVGLGLIKGKVVKLPPTVKTPHIGWNSIKIRKHSPLLKGVRDGEYFYFVHSYAPVVEEEEAIIATTNYGVEIHAVVAKENVMGTLFHPEKSSQYGLQVLKNFIAISRGRRC